jgi:hypothetical protein
MRYLWIIIVNCFYLFTVLVVLYKLGHRPEAVVVAVLGLIYVGIRTLMVNQIIFEAKAFVQLHEQLFYMRKLLNDPKVDAVYADFQKSGEVNKSAVYPSVYLESFFLFLICLVCLLVLFTSLPST